MNKTVNSGKNIARGDEMKKPNKTFSKKYISSLVVAAVMLLSVLTAYNININNPEEKSVEPKTQETLNQGGVENTEDEESTEQEENVDDGKENEEETRRDSRNTEENESLDQSGEENTARQKYTYEGEKTLEWPVIGNIILPYSMDTTVYYTTLDQYACNDGILIDAKIGDEVVAAADGRVVNVADSDRYGTTVTMLIGEYYEVYYSQIDHVKCEIGDEVKAGEVIGLVAKPTRSFILEGPHLFFKMTCRGEAVNPSDYLK